MSSPSLFIPCLVDLFLPEIGEACLQVLRRLDLDPVYRPEQTCCGQPAIHAGYVRKAKDSAKHFINVFGEDEAVVCPAGSCVCTVKDRYPELLQDEPDWLRRAEDLAPRVYEFSQDLVDVLQVEDVGARHEGKVTYHESCRVLNGLGVSEQPKKLIQAVTGVEFVPMQGAQVCCGFGGEFSTNYPEISEVLVSEKVANYIASHADLLVACDPGCLLNIGGYLKRNHPDREAVHIASFLAKAIQDDKR
ncbi:MAG: (Fe-S)-binding protein [bacterium]|nr:MAG: (Fe-S)-binding protein [bacterium]